MNVTAFIKRMFSSTKPWLISILAVMTGPLAVNYYDVENTSSIFNDINLQLKYGDWKRIEGRELINIINFREYNRQPVKQYHASYRNRGQILYFGAGIYIKDINKDYVPYRIKLMRNKVMRVSSKSSGVNIFEDNYESVEYTNISNGKKSLLIKWYLIGNKAYFNRYSAKLGEILAILNNNKYGTIFYVYIDCDKACEYTLENAKSFVKLVIDDIGRTEN